MVSFRIAGHQYAELAVLGEDPEEKGGPLEQSRLQQTGQSAVAQLCRIQTAVLCSTCRRLLL